MKKQLTTFLFLLVLPICIIGATTSYEPKFSTAGFFELSNTGRKVYSMNPAWRFHKGSAIDAEKSEFDDSSWEVVSLPNGIEYLPTEASGCINYQGEVWYRKHFVPEISLKGKKLFLHFEAIMGKSKVFVNGKLLKEHFGGYLPVIVDVTDELLLGEENIIAVWADNSNDPIYPPGKPQEVLDFTYFGGIYRDCWLVTHNQVYITDPNYEDAVANGGLFVSYGEISEKSAEINLQLQVKNEKKNVFIGKIIYELTKADGEAVSKLVHKLRIDPSKTETAKDLLKVKAPLLWSPEEPNLYNLNIRIYDNHGKVIDGYRRRIGVRSIEFKGTDGFWLNGKPYEGHLIGANRHQEFAVVGHAIPNSIHWRDAKKLRDVGLKVIRNAHCPQDPAFMDACDELGLFVIVNTPGWQFWNNEPIFAERVYNDIRNVVRRDRNHPSVWMWEPILNETNYPADFALKAKNIVEEEYPYPYCYSSCDSRAKGHEYYTATQFSHPKTGEARFASNKAEPNISYFTREWGDNVDDWSSHNSPSRVARNWGEAAMLIQAQHYAKTNYPYTTYDNLMRAPRQFVGGCLWHSFDHQRGYHPDPFYGGLMDVFRQPKFSYYMFMSQRSTEIQEEQLFETGPMVYIAHEMTPFSSKDVTVYSNCDEVRLTYNKDGKTWTYKKEENQMGMKSPIIVFKDVYDFMIDKNMTMYENKKDEVFLFAEGLIDGKVVATHKVFPARRPEKIHLWLDDDGVGLVSDGSDFVTVVAAITDRNGNIKRLNNDYIKFQVEGEGTIIGGQDVLANPAPVKWGTAPVLIRSTLKPGKIKVTASVLFEGSQMPVSAELEFMSKPASFPQIYKEEEVKYLPTALQTSFTKMKDSRFLEQERIQKAENIAKLKEVEQQQKDFGEEKK